MDEGDEGMMGKCEMKRCAREAGRRPGCAGFTLVEIVVCLLLGTLIVGGVMGLFSSSLHQQQRMKEKAEDWPVLEAAAQIILADPESALNGVVSVDGLPGAPVVDVYLTQVDLGSEGTDAQSEAGRLYRAELHFRSSMLELSLIVPKEKE